MRNSTLVLIILIIVIAVGVFLAGSYFRYGVGTATSTPVSTATTTEPDPYADTSAWQLYQGPSFSIRYPLDFEAAEVHNGTSTDWRMNANGNPGTLDFTITIPKAFEPQTNFSDAKLSVGESADTKALADCMTPDPSGGPTTSLTTKTIGGVPFTVFTSSDAGAGNLYDSWSYRAVHGTRCYAIEYTIHSTQLANYPASYNLHAFDEARVQAVLDRIVNTFAFR